MRKINFLYYLAGFFDGEGSLGIYRQNSKKSQRSFFLAVSISQKVTPISMKVVKRIINEFGGSYYFWKTKSGTKMWKWQVDRSRAEIFLRRIMPVLIIKQEQAKIALKWQRSKNILKSGPINKTSRKWDKWIDKTIKISNHLKKLKGRSI